MRNRRPFACPSCGDLLAEVVLCPRCGVVALDADGRPPVAAPAPMRPRPGWSHVALTAMPALLALVVWRAAPSTAPWVAAAGAASLVLFLLLWGPALGARWRARRARAASAARRSRAGVLRTIGDLTDGPARVRGRVRILRPVRAPTGDLVAAFRAPVVEVRRPAKRWPRVAEDLVDVTASGRFVVDDGTGLALIDDDAITMEPIDGGQGGAGLRLRDGDLVEVVGRVRREPAPDALEGSSGDTVLVFDGDRREPTLLSPLALDAAMAPPRLVAKTTTVPAGLATKEHEALVQLEAAGRADAERSGRGTGSGR